jgi:hypothetical protein
MTVRLIPENYSTLQSAHNASDAYDTLLISQDSFSEVLVMTKPLHFKGMLENQGVKIYPRYGGAIRIDYAMTAPIIFENINFEWSGANGPAILFKAQTHKEIGSAILNQCRCTAANPSLAYADAGTANVQLILQHCTITDRFSVIKTGDSFALSGRTNCKIQIRACHFSDPTTPTDCCAGKEVYAVLDFVTAATEGYGAEHGAELWREGEHWVNFKIRGTVTMPAVDQAAQCTVLLYRETSTGAMNWQPFASTTPNASTTAYGFDYLPDDRRFYVACIPPDGYAPIIHGKVFPSIL